jgi:hypothetical protein
MKDKYKITSVFPNWHWFEIFIWWHFWRIAKFDGVSIQVYQGVHTTHSKAYVIHMSDEDNVALEMKPSLTPLGRISYFWWWNLKWCTCSICQFKQLISVQGKVNKVPQKKKTQFSISWIIIANAINFFSNDVKKAWEIKIDHDWNKSHLNVVKWTNK